jgi:energy-coupling factor transporter transmembrane protein EcfT
MQSASPVQPRQWSSLVFYFYMFVLVAQLFGGALIMMGTTKIGGRFFLGVLGMALPNIVLAAFFALALNPPREGEKALCVDEKIVLTDFAQLALLLSAVDLASYLIHAFRHGTARSLQPSEAFGDSGTSYTATVLTLLISAAVLIWAALDVVAVYCHEGARPHSVTFEGKNVIRCEEETTEVKPHAF